MVMGSLGPVVFSTSSLRVLTPTGMNRTSGKRTAKQEVISGKPRTEYLGPDLAKLSFSIRLDVTYGVQPRAMIDMLRLMAEQRGAYLLVIGGRPIGENPWSLDSVSEEWGTVYSAGELASANVKLTLTEYVPLL